MNAHPEPLIKIGAEGGSITLFGVTTADGSWHYWRSTHDETPTYLDPEEGGDVIRHTSGWVDTWPEALVLLDRYPWARLSPMYVHPDFRSRVWEAVQERLEGEDGSQVQRSLERWGKRCATSPTP